MPKLVRGVQLCTRFDQETHNIKVTMHCCNVKRRHAIIVLDVDVCAVPDQQLHDFRSNMNGVNKRRPPTTIADVDVCTVPDQELQDLGSSMNAVKDRVI